MKSWATLKHEKCFKHCELIYQDKFEMILKQTRKFFAKNK